MAPFSRLIRFESGGKKYFSDLGSDAMELPLPGAVIKAYPSVEDLTEDRNSSLLAVDQV